MYRVIRQTALVSESVLRWVGVVVSLVGLVVTAPAAFLDVLRRTAKALRLYSHPANVAAPAAQATAVAIAASVRVSAHWPADGTIEAKVEALRADLLKARADHDQLAERVDRSDTAIRAELAEAVGKIDTQIQRLWARFDVNERRSIQINAAGLPLVAGGVILTGLSIELARVEAVGWTAVALVIVYALAVVVRSRPHRWLRANW